MNKRRQQAAWAPPASAGMQMGGAAAFQRRRRLLLLFRDKLWHLFRGSGLRQHATGGKQPGSKGIKYIIIYLSI